MVLVPCALALAVRVTMPLTVPGALATVTLGVQDPP
jgi:hypothetical protein